MIGTVDRHEMVRLIERGVDIQMVAAKMGMGVSELQILLQEPECQQELENLRAEREFRLLCEQDAFREARGKAAAALVAVLDDPDAKYADKIKAANTILDREPDRLFAKTERKEYVGRVELGYDRNSFLEHTGRVLGKVGCLPGRVLQSRYLDDAVVTDGVGEEDDGLI